MLVKNELLFVVLFVYEEATVDATETGQARQLELERCVWRGLQRAAAMFATAMCVMDLGDSNGCGTKLVFC